MVENIRFINVDSRKYIELTPGVEQALSAFFAQNGHTAGNLKRKRESKQETKRIEQAKEKSCAMTLKEKAATFDISPEGKSGNIYVDIHVALKGMEQSVLDNTAIWPWYEKLLDCKKALGAKVPPQFITFLVLYGYSDTLLEICIRDEIDEAQKEIIPLAYDSLNGIPNPLL